MIEIDVEYNCGHVETRTYASEEEADYDAIERASDTHVPCFPICMEAVFRERYAPRAPQQPPAVAEEPPEAEEDGLWGPEDDESDE